MEQWRAIPGYEGLYEASNLGRIRSAEGKITSNKRCEKRIWKQRIMHQKIQSRKTDSGSDARVDLWKDGNEKTFLVARLVAMAWCDGYREGLTVNHKDGNSLNNRAENLEWISKGDNIRHGFETGLYKTQIRCWLADETGITKIYRSLSQASRMLGRNERYISGCLKHSRPAYSADGRKFQIV